MVLAVAHAAAEHTLCAKLRMASRMLLGRAAGFKKVQGRCQPGIF